MADPIDELRGLAAAAPAPPAAMARYLDTVRERAYTVTDGDVEALKDDGFTEDELFEQTIAVALGEGLRRLDLARAAIE
jgi:hypothetical protein